MQVRMVRRILLLILTILFGCNMTPLEKKALKIGEDYVASNFKQFDARNLKPVLKEEADYFVFYYHMPDSLGGTPVVHIDKRTMHVIDSYLAQ